MKRDSRALEGRDHDVLVIGGGIAGAWAAWEAASRGLSAALVELEDFGQATSWSSLKTAHGGLRHLQRLDLLGFRESMRERRALLRVAPEIVRPLKFAIRSPGLVDRGKYFLGGALNDILSFDRNRDLRTDCWIGSSGIVDRARATSLGGEALAGAPAFVWWDAQITHTERLLMGLLHAAVSASAQIINRCRLTQAVRTSSGFEIKATDLVSARDFGFHARSVVNASGRHLEAVSRQFDETCGSPLMIRGINLVLGEGAVPNLAIGAKDQGRFLFLVPWLGRSILGTSYDDGRQPLGDLVRELVDAGRRAFPWADIREDRVKVVHSGHVPGSTSLEPVYRSGLIRHADSRIVSVLTAKYTTARAVAEAAIDVVGRSLPRSLPPSVSAALELPLARPLSGTLSERINLALDAEMALGSEDAIRGRLIEGACGETVPDAPGA